MRIILLSVFVVLFCSAFFPASAESPIKIHLNENYGFWIEFPVSWFFDDTVILIDPVPGMNSGAQILATIHDGVHYWNHFASVTLITDDYIAMNHEGQDFFDNLVEELQSSCDGATFAMPGYECIDYNVISTENFVINGSQAYFIQEQWTELYPDGTNSSKIASITNVVVGNDVWQIDTISDAEEYPDYAEEMEAIPRSFKFVPVQEEQVPIPEIPDWIRNNADWWVQGLITDDDFVSGIQYLIKEEIMQIPQTEQTSYSEGAEEIPSWIKNNADWWAQGLISDSDFVKGIQYLVQHGIIQV